VEGDEVPRDDSGEYGDALPLLEKIVADHPSDLVAKEPLTLLDRRYTAPPSDPVERKKVRARPGP
jgi:hypothetical protein